MLTRSARAVLLGRLLEVPLRCPCTSADADRSHWKEHKPNCEEFAKGARTFKTVESAAFSLTDVMHGGRRNKPKSTADSGSVMTIKVQTAASKLMPILIYNRCVRASPVLS